VRNQRILLTDVTRFRIMVVVNRVIPSVSVWGVPGVSHEKLALGGDFARCEF